MTFAGIGPLAYADVNPSAAGLGYIGNPLLPALICPLSSPGSRRRTPIKRCGCSMRTCRVNTSRLRCSLDGLRTIQQQTGVLGTVKYDGGVQSENILVSGFENSLPKGLRAEAVEHAIASGTLLVDRSHWGVVVVAGDDRLRFLHGQGTNAFDGVAEGQVVPTCFTSNVGRVVDFCEAIVMKDEVWLLSSPHRWETLLGNFKKYIFPVDRTSVAALPEDVAIFSLAGPKAMDSLLLAGCDANPAPGRSLRWEFEGANVVLLSHSRAMTRRSGPGVVEDDDGIPSKGVSGEGDPFYTLLVPWSVSAHLWSLLSKLRSVITAGEEEWQFMRIKQGVPQPGKELTDEYNPLEAGLWHSVHFDKGCYIGQETISRVNAYDAVKVNLQGVVFDAAAPVHEGMELISEETHLRAGVVTSLLDADASLHRHGLAYIRTKAGGPGLKVSSRDGTAVGVVTDIPYPTRSDAESAQPPVKRDKPPETSIHVGGIEDESAKEKARKAAKLAAVQKKLDALKARREASTATSQQRQQP